ncbi:hypothetical protein [Metallosphaera hakonensis]|uniref:hypothetical protein n=1 Tax=Metallosphaera hakonensis TaxID=79601 RepID=UPI00144320B8|nr:hypothetical protein [Metallosphaera hakonensis]AWS00168.2 hypothetical protein DFR87_11250 [Metallosphaera hakonensis JCM 8857 = DSM 7519]
MKLFGIKVDSLLTSQTTHLVTMSTYIPEYGEEKPKIVSLDSDRRVLRELVILRESILPGKRIQPGYKVEVYAVSDGKLSSFSKARTLTIVPRILKGQNWLRGELIILAKKDEPEAILVLHDVPALGKSNQDVKKELIQFLGGWGVHVNKLPVIVKNSKLSEKMKIKAKLIDIDYLLSSSLP